MSMVPTQTRRDTPRSPSVPWMKEQKAAAQHSALQMLTRLSAQQQLAHINHQLILTGLLVATVLNDRSRVEEQLREAEQAEQDACTQELGVAIRRYLHQGGRAWRSPT